MKSVAKTALALVGIGLLYAGLLRFALPLNGLWTGDQGAKLVQVVSLLRSRFADAAIPYPGAAIDPDYTFAPLVALYTWPRDGQYYSIFSYPYAALTALPFFALGYPGLYIVPVLATLVSAALGAALGRRLGLGPPWLLVLILGLATPLGFYALVFWEHALATALALGALLLVSRPLSDGVATGQGLPNSGTSRPAARQLGRYALAGLLAGVAWWVRAEALWLTPALLAGMLWARDDRRLVAATAGGALLAVGALLGFNMALFGPPLGPQVALNYAGPLADPGAFVGLRLQIAGDLLVGMSRWAWAWAGVWLCVLIGLIWPMVRPAALAGIAACALAGLLLTQPRDLHWTGLANTAPLALLALWRWRAGPAERLLLGFALIYSLGVLLSAPNGGGAQWGPRYLMPAIPPLVLLGLRAAQGLLGDGTGGPGLIAGRTRSQQPNAPAPVAGLPPPVAAILIRASLALLLLTSLGTQARGIELLRSSLGQSLRIVQVANAQPMRVLVSDAVFGPQLLAPLYYERPILLVTEPSRWALLGERLARAGEPGFVYLTAQPRDQAAESLRPLGISCTLIEGMAFGLNMFTCQVVAPVARATSTPSLSSRGPRSDRVQGRAISTQRIAVSRLRLPRPGDRTG